MLYNYHTHTTFCDGKNTPQEIVEGAIQKRFDAIGFSGHIHVPGTAYGIKDIKGYIDEVNRLKKVYDGKIQIYLGLEEDSFKLCDRGDFDYIIGSCHFMDCDGVLYPIDSNPGCFKKCLEVFNYDIIKLATTYYDKFCGYIKQRKPDIIGHFDLITKFDQMDESLFLNNSDYLSLSEKYLLDVMSDDIIFEVNTGAISRGFRTTPYPNENLLYTIKKQGGKVMLSSDSHAVETLDFAFDETKKYLKDIGFEYTYLLYNNEFIKDYIGE